MDKVVKFAKLEVRAAVGGRCCGSAESRGRSGRGQPQMAGAARVGRVLPLAPAQAEQEAGQCRPERGANEELGGAGPSPGTGETRSRAALVRGEREVRAWNSTEQSLLCGSIGAVAAWPKRSGESRGGGGAVPVALAKKSDRTRPEVAWLPPPKRGTAAEKWLHTARGGMSAASTTAEKWLDTARGGTAAAATGAASQSGDKRHSPREVERRGVAAAAGKQGDALPLPAGWKPGRSAAAQWEPGSVSHARWRWGWAGVPGPAAWGGRLGLRLKATPIFEKCLTVICYFVARCAAPRCKKKCAL